MVQQLEASERSLREKQVVDVEGSTYDANERLHGVFHHVRQAPNTDRGFDAFHDLIKRKALGASVLEIGCGSGAQSRRILNFGAKSVHGIDISTKLIELARTNLTDEGLEFSEHNIDRPLERHYDLVVGRAILHHLDFKEVLSRLYTDNLNPGGEMIFMEPLGENILLRLYWKFGGEFHTPDERPFYNADLAWLRTTFPGFQLLPVNYTTIPLGVISSFLFRDPDNPLMRFSDRMDTLLADRMAFLHSRYRSGIFRIVKPA